MIRLAAVLVVTALAAGCAGQPEPPPVQSSPATAPGGLWEVTEALAVEPMPGVKSPYLNQTMALDETIAGTPAGRVCATPAYLGRTVPAAEALDGADRPAEARDPAPRAVVDVTCGDEWFGAYVHLDDGSLLTRVNSWVLRLERAKPAPEPVPVAEAPPAPAPLVPAPEPVASKAEDKRTIVYLASYKTEKHAHAGWATLAKASPILAGQKPVTRSVDLGAKGTWVRLYGMAADEVERTLICKQVGKRVDECGARNRE